MADIMFLDPVTSRPLPPIILVVDDDADTRELYETLLNLEGYWVAEAADAIAALDKAEDLQPDVVITDIGLPGGCDGVSFAERLHARARTTDIPVVAITGRPVRDFEGAGFIQVLQKPILPETLIASVRAALEVSREVRARSMRARERVPGLLETSERPLRTSRGIADRLNRRTKP